MMIKTRLLPSLVLLAVFLASCAPAASPVVTAPPTAVETATQPNAEPTDSLAPSVPVVATSRGPNLEATDPSTVNLAAGQLQLVEFFRFT